MVSFICDACGNTVKKTQVEKHYTTQCRNCSVLSCLDCGVDFPGDAYLKHTSCITEAEKYQGHLYQAKDKENKGEQKQKEWVKNVHGLTGNTTDPKLKGLLKRLTAYSNIPRKRKKFDNFCKNSVNVYDAKTLDQLWDLFNVGNQPAKSAVEDEADKVKETIENKSSEDASEGTSEDTSEDKEVENKGEALTETEPVAPVEKKKKKKRKRLEEPVENGGSVENKMEDELVEEPKKKRKKNKTKVVENGGPPSDNCQILNPQEKGNVDTNEVKNKKKKKKNIKTVHENGVTEIENENQSIEISGDPSDDNKESPRTTKFHWHKAIKLALKQNQDQELPLKKLRKKVLSAYQEHGVDHRATNDNECMSLFDKKLKSYPKVKIIKDVVKLIK